MYTSFDNLPDEAGLWIYQSAQPWSNDTGEKIAAAAHQFCEQWAVHGHPIQASFLQVENRFLILAAGSAEHGASGCSIDSSVRFVKELEQLHKISLTDRTAVTLKTPEGDVYALPLMEFKSKLKTGDLPADTLIFDTTFTKVGQLRGNFPTAMATSWAGRFLPANEMSR